MNNTRVVGVVDVSLNLWMYFLTSICFLYFSMFTMSHISYPE